MKKYIGLTIGPIYKTLQDARKTRELWAGSYFFSYIMKLIIEGFKHRPFITPYVDENDPDFLGMLKGIMPVGVFHDRIIFEAQDNDYDKLSDTIEKILSDVSKEIAEHIREDGTNVSSYLNKYLQLYFCELDYDGDTPHSVINKDMNRHLDSLELQESFVPCEERGYFAEFLRRANNSFLIEKAFGRRSERFKSLPEIAVSELNLNKLNPEKYRDIFESYDDKEEQLKEGYDLYEDIKEKYRKQKVQLSQYHKYIAIVHADGDSLGKTIESITDNGQFKEFSRKLFTFALEAHEAIKTFGGETIFAGGDDLLFFAPVVNQGKSIFELLDDIDILFRGQFKELKKGPTISFGVSISYYKFPLYEALETSREMLKKAKKAEANKDKKNAVAFRVLKHSGQYFEAVYMKGSLEHCYLMEFIRNIRPSDNISRLMTSLTHNIFRQNSVLGCIGGSPRKLESFFENNFNEAIHKIPENRNQINAIMKLIEAVYSSYNYQDDDERSRTVYSILRLNKFMRE